MNCNEFHQRLDEALDRHQSIDLPELKPHTLECAECREVWEDCLLLEPQVEAWNQSAAREVDLVDNVIAELQVPEVAVQTGTSPLEHISPAQQDPSRTTATSNRQWGVLVLSVACVCVAIVLAFALNPEDPQIADNDDKQHVVPDDLSNGPFDRNHQNVIELNPDDTELALLNRREVDDMVNNAQTGLESLGDSVRKQVSEISGIVPSNFDVWDASEMTDQEPDQTDSEPNPWLQRLFDTAEAFEPETT